MEKVSGVILEDGKKYSGYGEYKNSFFVPNGYGMKQYPDMYVKGNFENGVLNGPAIISHDYYMHTMQMKNNRGNGWGLCINGGVLIEFGYYKNSQLAVDLLPAVEWYYAKLEDSGRSNEDMLHIYTSKTDGTITDLHIGYSAKDMEGGIGLTSMGFHFLADGSVWVGNSGNNRPNGDLIKFCSDGYIQIGRFENGRLVEEFDIQELIDQYYGTYKVSDEFAQLFTFHKSSRQREREEKRKQFYNIQVDTTKNYFEL